MKTYLVGGAVRDKLLNYPTKDCDWVVVGANVEKMLALGFLPVGSDFPVFLHPETKDEYALARTERKTGKGYQGFSFYAAEDVSLEQDLSRRDLTINAIAQAEDGTLTDPFNGQRDLDLKILRHVSQAFSEDPLRVLRTARFAARYAHLGFKIAPETEQLMTEISLSGELKHLSAERVWQEIERALEERSPLVFFKSLQNSESLAELLPTFNNLVQHLIALKSNQWTDPQVRICALNNPAKRFSWLNYVSQLNVPKQKQIENTKDLVRKLRCSKHCKYLISQTVALMQLISNWKDSSAQDKLIFLQSAGVLRDKNKLTELIDIVTELHFEKDSINEFEEQCNLLKSFVTQITNIDHKSLILEGFSGAGLGNEINRKQLIICQG